MHVYCTCAQTLRSLGFSHAFPMFPVFQEEDLRALGDRLDQALKGQDSLAAADIFHEALEVSGGKFQPPWDPKTMTIQDQYEPMTILLSSKYYGSYYHIISYYHYPKTMTII